MSGARILVIDDEPQIRRLLQVALSAHGYAVVTAETGRDGIAAAATQRPDLVILDLGLPDMSGLDVLREVRGWSRVPVVILSVHGREEEKVAALDAGADDYVTKPFAMGELLARLRVALRHAAGEASSPVLRFGELVIDLPRRMVTLGGREIRLTPTEYDILKLLARHAGKVLTHHQILREVWGAGYDDAHLVRVHVAQLRRKLEPDRMRPRFIRTEPGVGYRLVEPAETGSEAAGGAGAPS
ncbi:response regulator transcription factor [Carboxydochorda subterranea]|uniref:Response regulator transcription factor n=1 Tax=Carboxydichorda subterranea TaxID=3109565 RepID=A0ABZ1C0N1_9FIRM|nr:response regulator transcription factor [Limnochorda sp. L945t]WRP18654.1 response regulator transcription factor [Limnochorda sp. L945t]